MKTAAPLSMASTVPESDIIVDQVSLVRCGGLGGGPVKEIPLFQFVDLTMFLIVMCVWIENETELANTERCSL